MKNKKKLFFRVFIFTFIFYALFCVLMATIGELSGMSDKAYDNMLNIGIVVSVVIVSVIAIYFVITPEKVKMKDEKIKDYKNFVIADVLSADNKIFGVYLYKYENDSYKERFFISLYSGSKLENSDLILNKISSFCEDYAIIFDTVSCRNDFDSLFTNNFKKALGNEKIAINEYVRIKNIKKDFARSEYEFTPIEDVFVECSKTLNSYSTRQLFDGKFLYILSYYNGLKEESL